MFDIGFTELMVVGGVALVVLGPEKLAVVARSAGKWTSKAQRYVNDVKADIAREGELAELRKLKTEMETAGRDISGSISTSLREVESQVQHDLTALESTVKSDSAAAPLTNNTALASETSAGIVAPENDVSTPTSPQAASLLSDEQASLSIQASLDTNAHYQSSLDATLSPPPLNDPYALRMELEVLQDDFAALETRMAELKRQIVQTSNEPKAHA